MISFELSDVQKSIRQAARTFASEEIAPSVLHRDGCSEFPTEIIKKAGEMGFMGMTVPEQYGGAGMDYISYSLVLTEISKVDASVAIAVSVQNSLVNWILETYGSEAQKEKYLRPLAEGKYLGAYCLSEAEAGSDAAAVSTRAELIDGKWQLNGMKSWISSGNYADLFIVFARTDQNAGHKGISCFIVEKGCKGLSTGKPEEKMGMKSSDTCSVSFDNVKLDESNLIGNLGQGFYIAMNGLNGGRIGIASQALGIAKGAFEAALEYSKQRKSMGKYISEHQMIQHKLAQMSMKISAAEMLVLKAAYLRCKGLPHARPASEAKLFASSIANDVTRESVQIHGGYGYVKEYHVERMMRDAKITEIYEGTSEIQSIVIAKELTKEYREFLI